MFQISGKGWTVTEEDGEVPVVDGKIEVSLNFRGGNNCIPVEGILGLEKFTKEGYRYKEVISAFQKAIRRGLGLEALYWANVAWNMAGASRSNVRNRLLVIMAEDIGIGNSTFSTAALRHYPGLLDKKLDDKKAFMEIVWAAAISPKCRQADSITHAWMEKPAKGWNDKNSAPSRRRRSTYEGYMSEFRYSIKKKKAEHCCYWVQKIFELPTWNTKKRSTSRGKSADPMYGIWEELMKHTKDKAVFNTLLRLYDHRKNGRTERLFVNQAILHVCKKDESKKWWWNVANDDDEDKFFTIPPEIERKILGNEMTPRVMPDWAIDCHTGRGRLRKKGVKEFWTDGAQLKDEIMDDPYADLAMKRGIERETAKVKPARRKKRKRKTKNSKEGLLRKKRKLV